ncbi:MAG: AAA family ATPase, partial [Paludibacteraceae bacterium]|nr:AAA family ATPase [Paludibacteraceae bacterium]
MVIDKVTFHNWVGFYYGMHTDTFEIDFTKRKHRMCLVFGTNGSGKTTLLE